MTSKKPIINFVYLTPAWKELSTDLEVNVSLALETATGLLKRDFSQEEVSIVFSSDTEVQVLNKTFRNQDKPTDVLSFPSTEKEELGDIILAYETVMEDAKKSHILPLHHILHLIVHGFLHLLGYDHEEDEEAHQMENLEIKILEKLNIKNPYEDE